MEFMEFMSELDHLGTFISKDALTDLLVAKGWDVSDFTDFAYFTKNLPVPPEPSEDACVDSCVDSVFVKLGWHDGQVYYALVTAGPFPARPSRHGQRHMFTGIQCLLGESRLREESTDAKSWTTAPGMDPAAAKREFYSAAFDFQHGPKTIFCSANSGKAWYQWCMPRFYQLLWRKMQGICLCGCSYPKIHRCKYQC